MKELIQYIAFLPKALGGRAAPVKLALPLSAGALRLFLMGTLAMSILGGYQLTHVTHSINNAYNLPQRGAAQLLVIEESLDDAAIDFGRQIQEWKDMLLRVNDEERYSAHRKAFIASSIEVQKALWRARVQMQSIGLGTDEVDQLIVEHKALVLKYVSAQSRLDARRPESSRAADQQVMGIDRDFHREIATVKSNVEFLAKQQLSGTVSGSQYLLLGLLGTLSLLFMAFIGFAFASGLLARKPGAGEHSYS